MGTTFVSINNKQGFWMRDAVLEIWLRFLALHVEDPAKPGSLNTIIRDQWLLASRGYFNGCVPDGLDEAVATAEGSQIVRQAISSLMQSLKKAPPALSKDVLNIMGMEGEFGKDIETWRLMEISQAFLDLLDGKIIHDASSAAFMPGCGDVPSAFS